jgi:hypothetical protein
MNPRGGASPRLSRLQPGSGRLPKINSPKLLEIHLKEKNDIARRRMASAP